MQFKPCLWCIYIGLAHYYSIAVGYSYNTLLQYNIDTECTRAIASTLIHAVVLCESAQRYRALMVILQSHRRQNLILRCYPNVSAILRRHTNSCLLCFFNNPSFNSQNFFIYLSPLFFYMLCSIRREHSSFAPPKKWLFSRASNARARRAQALNIAAAYFLSCRVQRAGRTCSKKTACLNFLCLLPMVLMTRGLGTGATFMRGSYYYVAEPRLLRERTVLVKSEHELHHW